MPRLCPSSTGRVRSPMTGGSLGLPDNVSSHTPMRGLCGNCRAAGDPSAPNHTDELAASGTHEAGFGPRWCSLPQNERPSISHRYIPAIFHSGLYCGLGDPIKCTLNRTQGSRSPVANVRGAGVAGPQDVGEASPPHPRTALGIRAQCRALGFHTSRQQCPMTSG
jgi:hypothetical protein